MSSTDDPQTDDTDNLIRAEALKAEGNVLHVQGDHHAAYAKYTEAIELDDQNAVLYANRAAASLSLKEYLDAGSDCRKAVQLDPVYSKAWGRLAKAQHELGEYWRSIDTWQMALATLPKTNLSGNDKKLRQQFQEGLKLANRGMDELNQGDPKLAMSMSMSAGCDGQLPWNRAAAMEDKLTGEGVTSSAWVILNAYKDFSEGVRLMKQLKTHENRIEGRPMAITHISNGVLRDWRVLHMDSKEYLEMYSAQLVFEYSIYMGWRHGGASIVIEEAPKRLLSQGWDIVRWALNITVRAWTMRAHVSSQLDQHEVASSFFNSAITVLEWGAEKWKDVPAEQRGPIFDGPFIRGVKRLRIDAYLVAFRALGETANFSLIALMRMAMELLEDVDAAGPPDYGPQTIDAGFGLSFWNYPRASAHVAVGYCRGFMASKTPDPEKANSLWKEAGECYKQAALCHPPDDEYYLYFWKLAIETYWHRKEPLREVLPLLRVLREKIPDAQKIWEHGMRWGMIMKELTPALEFDEKASSGIADKIYTLETPSPDVGPLI